VDPRIETSLSTALATGDFYDLLDRAAPGLGLPGTKPRLELARELGHAIARERDRGRKLARALGNTDREDARFVAAAAFGAFVAQGGNRREPLADLQELADDSRNAIRIGVIDAVRTMLNADLNATLIDLQAWTDGFLQAHIALEAIIDRQILSTITSAEPLLSLLNPTWDLADGSPRAADRWQGVRILRQGLPLQITAFVGRFSELFAWVMERAVATTRPEMREVVDKTIEALERASFRRADVDTLRAAMTKSAKPPRDPSRIVHGTRKRSKH